MPYVFPSAVSTCYKLSLIKLCVKEKGPRGLDLQSANHVNDTHFSSPETYVYILIVNCYYKTIVEAVVTGEVILGLVGQFPINFIRNLKVA